MWMGLGEGAICLDGLLAGGVWRYSIAVAASREGCKFDGWGEVRGCGLSGRWGE